MNPIIHFLGICIKFFLINIKAELLYLKQKNTILNTNEINTIVFTHNLGGGTESYVRKNFYNPNILIIRLISYRNDSFFILEHEKEKRAIKLNSLFQFLNKLELDRIIVNSLCAYNKPSRIINYVLSRKDNCSITYLVHDYHSACPSVMFIQGKKFCQYKCENCSIGKKEIIEWRNNWERFLSNCNNIICFSKSSKEILCRFYEEIESKIQVIPHSMDYCNFTSLNLDLNCRNVAIIGNCSNIAKGKLVIKNLIPEFKKSKNRKLYIIGKVPFLFHHNSKYVKYTGPYDLKFLPETLKSGKIGVIVFTSILPETFSYAISEFMKLGLYIVSLELGAQGEKLKNYDKAIFVANLEAKTIMEGIEKCFI